jgi:hypothetical protein
MKKFLIKISLFLSLFALLYIAIFSMADGNTDAYYLRFTTAKQSSLILGTSRAAQGIQPETINQVLDRSDLFNYSFTVANSSYGPAYKKSVKRKLDTNKDEGVFILSVDPWSISSRSEEPENPDTFFENELFINSMRFVNMNPNVEYLIFEFQGSYFRILINAAKKAAGQKNINPVKLNEDGWLNIDIPMDSLSVHQRTLNKLEEYREGNLPYFTPSSTRLHYLRETIEYLQGFGKVYLVRLPIPSEMLEIENELYPNFDSQLKSLSNITKAPYLSFAEHGDSYIYTDGNHLYKTSAETVSREIANWIQFENKTTGN